MDDQVQEVARDIFSNVRRIGSLLARRTRRQTEVTAEEIAPAGGLLGVGLVMAGVGGMLLLTTPVVPKRQRRVRRRMLTVSMLYLTVGGAAAALGGVAARNVVRTRARRAARDIERGTESIRHEVEHQM